MKKKYTREELMRIGQEVASGWGACCIDYKEEKDGVVFYCNEFGENFTTKLTYEELGKYK